MVMKVVETPLRQQIRYRLLDMSRLAFIIFITGSISAMLLYPKYSLKEKYLSELGVNDQSADTFNNTLYITSILLFVSFIGIYISLKQFMNRSSLPFLRLAVMFGIISSYFLYLVAKIPARKGQLAKHDLVASVFFGFLAISLLFLTLSVIFAYQQVEQSVGWTNYLGFSFVFLVILLSNRSVWYSMILQKIIVYTSLIFFISLVSRIKRLLLFIQVDKGDPDKLPSRQSDYHRITNNIKIT